MSWMWQSYLKDEHQFVKQLLQSITHSIPSTDYPTVPFHRLPPELFRGEVPSAWRSVWEGSSTRLDVYLKDVTQRVAYLKEISSGKGEAPVQLDRLFRPGWLLSTLRRATARSLQIPLHSLRLHATWGTPEFKASLGVTGIRLEGATFDGHQLQRDQSRSQNVALPKCWLTWAVPEGRQEETLLVPLYADIRREQHLAEIAIPVCQSKDKELWTLASPALYVN